MGGIIGDLLVMGFSHENIPKMGWFFWGFCFVIPIPSELQNEFHTPLVPNEIHRGEFWTGNSTTFHNWDHGSGVVFCMNGIDVWCWIDGFSPELGDHGDGLQLTFQKKYEASSNSDNSGIGEKVPYFFRVGFTSTYNCIPHAGELSPDSPRKKWNGWLTWGSGWAAFLRCFPYGPA